MFIEKSAFIPYGAISVTGFTRLRLANPRQVSFTPSFPGISEQEESYNKQTIKTAFSKS